MHLGITGTQTIEKVSEERLKYLCLVLESLVGTYTHFHHGDCVGIDEYAARYAHSLGYRIVCHPPKNSLKRAMTMYHDIYPALDYLDRNRQIVLHSDLVLAIPVDPNKEVLCSGTWACVRYARKVGRPLAII